MNHGTTLLRSFSVLFAAGVAAAVVPETAAGLTRADKLRVIPSLFYLLGTSHGEQANEV